MSSDTKRREMERAAALGDQEAAARLARDRNRVGEGRVSLLRRYVGRVVYIEGARMNYLGTLSGVTAGADGGPAELLFSALTRVGDWGRNGPNQAHCQDMPASEELPAMVPWAAVDQFSLSPWG